MIFRGESMRSLTVVGGVNGAILLKGLAMGVSAFIAGHAAKQMSKAVSARTAQRNADVTKLESPTPAWASQLSTNSVETPVDAGVLISPQINHAAKLSQYVSRLVACMTVAQTERSAFRGDVIRNKPKMRFNFSRLRKNRGSLFANGCFALRSYLFSYPHRCQTNNVRGI